MDGKCEYETENGMCKLNECIYGDFLVMDDSRFGSGKYCWATCEKLKKAKERMGKNKNGRSEV